MANYEAKQINELFVDRLGTAEGLQKVAESTTTYIRTKLREESFARRVIQPEYVSQTELQRSVNHDTLVRIVDIEPDSEAMVVNFRGQPPTRYVNGERYEIPFFLVSSEDFQKTEEELMAYEMPLTEVIEKNSVLDIHEQEDKYFIETVDAAIAQEVANGNPTHVSGSYETNGSIPKNAVIDLLDTLDGNRLKTDVLLMDSTMYNKLALMAASEFDRTADLVINGYSYSTLFNRKLIVSNKVNLLANTIYAFAHQDFFGRFYVLNDSKFWIEKKKNLITWSVYENIGMGIGNISACAKLTLS